jgi:hypothetical protein
MNDRIVPGTNYLARLKGVCGADHPASRPVITPLGRFASVTLAAQAHGISPSAVSERATRGRDGWRYETPKR